MKEISPLIFSCQIPSRRSSLEAAFYIIPDSCHYCSHVVCFIHTCPAIRTGVENTRWLLCWRLVSSGCCEGLHYGIVSLPIRSAASHNHFRLRNGSEEIASPSCSHSGESSRKWHSRSRLQFGEKSMSAQRDKWGTFRIVSKHGMCFWYPQKV